MFHFPPAIYIFFSRKKSSFPLYYSSFKCFKALVNCTTVASVLHWEVIKVIIQHAQALYKKINIVCVTLLFLSRT